MEGSGLDRNDIGVDIGVFLRIPVDGEPRDYSIRQTAIFDPEAEGDARQTLIRVRSDKEDDWGPRENDEGFYTTTPLTEELSELPWEIRLKRNLPFDPERVAVMGAGLGANGALRYAGREDALTQTTILLSPRLGASDDLGRGDMRGLATAVARGDVLAFAATEDRMGMDALRELDKAENDRIVTREVGGSRALGVPLAAEPGVLPEIVMWIRERL